MHVFHVTASSQVLNSTNQTKSTTETYGSSFSPFLSSRSWRTCTRLVVQLPQIDDVLSCHIFLTSHFQIGFSYGCSWIANTVVICNRVSLAALSVSSQFLYRRTCSRRHAAHHVISGFWFIGLLFVRWLKVLDPGSLCQIYFSCPLFTRCFFRSFGSFFHINRNTD